MKNIKKDNNEMIILLSKIFEEEMGIKKENFINYFKKNGKYGE